MNMENLGTVLKKHRKRLDLSLRSVEKKTGISNAYLSQLENMKISNPSPLILHKLAECYQISYEYLLKLSGYPTLEASGDSQHKRIGRTIDGLTEDEEEKLIEYLQFLRSRRKG